MSEPVTVLSRMMVTSTVSAGIACEVQTHRHGLVDVKFFEVLFTTKKRKRRETALKALRNAAIRRGGHAHPVRARREIRAET